MCTGTSCTQKGVWVQQLCLASDHTCSTCFFPLFLHLPPACHVPWLCCFLCTDPRLSGHCCSSLFLLLDEQKGEGRATGRKQNWAVHEELPWAAALLCSLVLGLLPDVAFLQLLVEQWHEPVLEVTCWKNKPVIGRWKGFTILLKIHGGDSVFFLWFKCHTQSQALTLLIPCSSLSWVTEVCYGQFHHLLHHFSSSFSW